MILFEISIHLDIPRIAQKSFIGSDPSIFRYHLRDSKLKGVHLLAILSWMVTIESMLGCVSKVNQNQYLK